MAYSGLIGKPDNLNHTIKSGSVIGKSDNLNHKIMQIIKGQSDNLNHVLWKSAVPYTSTVVYAYNGHAYDSHLLQFYIGGSMPGFQVILTFAEPIEIDEASFYLQRQDEDIDVYFSGAVLFRDASNNNVFTLGASEDTGTSCSTSDINLKPTTKISNLVITGNGVNSRVTMLYMDLQIKVGGSYKPVYQSGEMEL